MRLKGAVLNMIHRKDMRIRDPFLVTDRENHCYYLVMNGGTVEDKHPNDAVFLRRRRFCKDHSVAHLFIAADYGVDGS